MDSASPQAPEVSRPPRRLVNFSGLRLVDNWQAAAALLAPLRCQFCAAAAQTLPLCSGCRAALPWNRRACPRCARPQTHDGVCARCLQRPPPFAAAWAPLCLEPPVQQGIHALKYRAALQHAHWLGVLFAESLRDRNCIRPDLLMPVPLHRWRQWRRGYNQSAELARQIGRHAGLHVETAWARRTRHTADQIGMDAAARRRNVRGAFHVDARVRGLRIALVDDVMTTGATLAELARAARHAGATEVQAWAIARAP